MTTNAASAPNQSIKRQQKRRVVVTGIGAVTPLGHTLPDTWNGLLEGKLVAALIKRFDATDYPSQIAYEVADFKLRRDLLQTGEEMYLNDATRFAINAAAEAMEQAKLTSVQIEPSRTAVCFGNGLTCPGLDWYSEVYLPKKFDDPSFTNHIRFFADQISSLLGRMIGAQGGVTTIHTACASSGQALGEAYEMIAYGDADLVLTGGSDSMINPFSAAGFALLGALSDRNEEPTTASRPFDRGRDGFVFGEGACVLIFEDYERAIQRGANIIAEVCGYGVTESAYRITDLHPEGRGPIEAMEMALNDAGIESSAVDYVNVHGTSTQLNDRIEALAIAKVFGEYSPRVFVSSTKSMTGHMIAAAGAIEFAFCVMALKHQLLPPSINIFEADPDCRISLTPKKVTAHAMRYALSNSVGFGGSNTAIIAGRIDT